MTPERNGWAVMHRILIVGHPGLARRFAPVLGYENLVASYEPDPYAGLRQASDKKPALLLLNLPLSGMTSVAFSTALRKYPARLPLVLLGDYEEAERVRLFEAGVDDYVLRPFSLRELLARVRAIVRRTVGPPAHIIRFGLIEADLDRRVITRAGNEVRFTPMEYHLLIYLLRHAGRVVSREEVLSCVWEYDTGVRTRTADMHVMRLRRKLEGDAAFAHHLQTVHGVGYRFLLEA